MAMNPAMSRSVGVRRPVYLQDVDRNRPPSDRGQTTTPTRKVSVPTVRPTALPMPSADALSNRLQQIRRETPSDSAPQFGSLGASLTPPRGGWSERQDVALDAVKDYYRDLSAGYDAQRAADAAAAVGGGAGGGGAALPDYGPARELLESRLAGVPASYQAEYDALAARAAAEEERLANIFGTSTGRIREAAATLQAALQSLDPQAAFVYDVGAPNIPGVSVDYLRALGASADPVSAEAEFARNILGYQLLASQRAAEGMTASMERERQARLAAALAMEQQGYTTAELNRVAALEDIARRRAEAEAQIRAEERAAADALRDRLLEIELAGAIA